MSGFEVQRASQLDPVAEELCWLVEGLWADQAVGIVGGEPKSGKSFLALDLAVAVASGAPCLGRFPVAKTGRVLLYAAEDAYHVVRQRLQGIAKAASVDFDSLDVFLIMTPVLRLDDSMHRERLQETVESVKPKLLVLDPFARIHSSIDENAATDVARVLAYLRGLQRRFHTAVLLVHHARKGAAHLRAGQALRGSTEFHGWGDSNLYLRRKGKDLLLSIEHRAAPSTDDLRIELIAEGETLALQVVEENASPDPPSSLTLEERIRRTLADAHKPLSIREIRSACKMRMENLCKTLRSMNDEGIVRKGKAGYQLNGK